MGTTYMAVNHEHKIAYEIGKFITNYLLQCPLTLENVYEALSSFSIDDFERRDYAKFIFDSLSKLNPKYDIVDDGADNFIDLYGEYIMIGSRYKDDHIAIVAQSGLSHKVGKKVYYGIEVKQYLKRNSTSVLMQNNFIKELDVSKIMNIGIKSNVFYAEDFESYFELSSEQKQNYTFFYFIVPLQSVVDLSKEQIESLTSPFVYIGAYGVIDGEYEAKIILNYFDTYDFAVRAKNQFDRNL